MSKAASKLHWQGRGVLLALALAIGIVALFLPSGIAKADPPLFNAWASTWISDYEHLANADIESEFGVDKEPWPSAMYGGQVSFTPSEWGVARGGDIPIGAVVGQLVANSTLAQLDAPCAQPLVVPFIPLLNCSTDTSDTVTFDEQFPDSFSLDEIPPGCWQYPDFLANMFPGKTPIARHAGWSRNPSTWVSLNFVTFPPGTNIPDEALPGMPSFSSDLGYVVMSVLNDPTAPLTPGKVTDLCPPLSTETVYYGLTKDFEFSAENEAGYAWRTNPPYGGTYTFNGYAQSIRDADGDGYDNSLDTCPHVVNEGDPTSAWDGDDDNDGLDNACDDTPTTKDWNPDGDDYKNRQDNCPFVDNDDQADQDFDRIGDACDQPDWNGDTVPDPGAEAFSPSVANGEFAEVWFASDVEIEGPEPPEPGTTMLAKAASAGDTEIEVVETAGFEKDNTIEIGEGATKDTNWITDIQSASAGTFSLFVELKFDHAAGEPVVKVADQAKPGEEAEGTPTPTPSPEASPSPEAEVTPTPEVELEICPPVFPGTYNGRVLINSQPAAPGYEVTATVGGEQWGSAIVSGGRYAMDIPDHLPAREPDCFVPGPITFDLNGMTCSPSPEWAPGIQDVDLTCAPAAPPVTPTPQVTPTVPPPPVTPTPKVTPTTVPPSGAGGLSGSSSGLPLWAMALAGWAGLMTVAGLGTLVAAKRR